MGDQNSLATRIEDSDENEAGITPNNNLAIAVVEDALGGLDVLVNDSAGTGIDPALATDYLDSQTVGHDLVGSGDLIIGPALIERGTAVTIAATSTDTNSFSVSVQWEDGNGNVFQSESAVDIGLDGITEDYARLVRKAPQVELTVTDESGAAQNNINIHADTER
jgi:hypothetical protein